MNNATKWVHDLDIAAIDKLLDAQVTKRKENMSAVDLCLFFNIKRSELNDAVICANFPDSLRTDIVPIWDSAAIDKWLNELRYKRLNCKTSRQRTRVDLDRTIAHVWLGHDKTKAYITTVLDFLATRPQGLTHTVEFGTLLALAPDHDTGMRAINYLVGTIDVLELVYYMRHTTDSTFKGKVSCLLEISVDTVRKAVADHAHPLTHEPHENIESLIIVKLRLTDDASRILALPICVDVGQAPTENVGYRETRVGWAGLDPLTDDPRGPQHMGDASADEV